MLAPNSDGQVSTSVSWNAPASGYHFTWRALSVTSSDADDRDYVTTYVHTNP